MKANKTNHSPAISFLFSFLIGLFILPDCLNAQHITVGGSKFMVNGYEIFFNGVNTPWDNWNDFGGNYDHNFWDSEFQRIRQSGGNASRIWITCDGEVGIDITNNGEVTGVKSKHWTDLDDLFDLARKHQVYIMATLISFDHTKNSHYRYMSWRRMFAGDTTIGSYIHNYVIPFINRYKDNPSLWCVDACNEIEWMHENSDNGQIPWLRLQYYVARVASAVHQNSSVLVTLGSAAVKWNSNCSGCEGNFWSDGNLQAQYNSPDAFLDFYSPHYYGWVVRWFGNFALDKTPASYGLTDRPCMVGESPATGVYTQNSSGVDELAVPIGQAFINTYNNGWRGLLVWTSNGVDQYGSLENCGVGLLNFFQAHPTLVDPSITGIGNTSEIFSDVKIYPNPSDGFLFVSHPDLTNLEISFIDFTGKKLSERYSNADSGLMLDIHSLKPGMYLMILSSGKLTGTFKVIKK